MVKSFKIILIFCFLSTGAFAGDSASDIATFYSNHEGMFKQLLEFYDPGDVTTQGDSTSEKTTTKKAGKRKAVSSAAVSAVLAVPPPVTQVFSAQSTWANMKATVINYHTHFKVMIETDAPAEKWILEEDKTKNELASGSLNDQENFVIDQPGEFKAGLNVSIMIYKDGLQYPSLLPLH